MVMPNKKEDIVIVGAGGHAKVIIDIINSQKKYKIIACIDQLEKVGTYIYGIEIMGDASSIEQLYVTAQYLVNSGITNAFVAIGDNRQRMVIANKMREWGFRMVNAISPFAYVAESAKLGDGIAVMPGAVINADAAIMDNAIVNTNATVEHDCVIMSNSHIAPGCTLAGNVTIGEGTLVGIGTKIIPNLQVGDWSVIGAGAVVVGNLPAQALALGVPAKVNKTFGGDYGSISIDFG